MANHALPSSPGGASEVPHVQMVPRRCGPPPGRLDHRRGHEQREIDKVARRLLCWPVDLVEQVQRNMVRHRLAPRRGGRLVAAVSGGLDSMVLFFVLRQLAEEYGWELCVAHYHHGLRGREATLDQKLVQRQARRFGVACETERGNVGKQARQKKLSVEMAAREMRHAFLAEAALRFRTRTVALAHHADDQVELFFLRLLRGSGSEGLSGMPWKNPSPARANVRLVRPFLDVPKSVLARFARERGVVFREDASNVSSEFLRNRLRAQLLPLLEERYQPGLRAVVTRLMTLLRDESDFVAEQARAVRPGQTADALSFDQWHPAIQRKVLQLALRDHGVDPAFDWVEALRLQSDQPVTTDHGRVFRRDQAGRLTEIPEIKPSFRPESKRVDLRGARHSIRFGKLRLQWDVTKATSRMPRKVRPGMEWFDADRVGEKVELRYWRQGDRFQPIGMPHPVKLQDWFTNLKVPAERRRSLVLATTDQGEIWWVQGLRIGERFKIRRNTKRRLRWSWS